MSEPDPKPTAEEIEEAWQASNAKKFKEWLHSLPPPPNKKPPAEPK